MCVWQSQAFAGISKFTRVAGCEALASSEPGNTVIAAPPIRTSRRLGIAPPLLYGEGNLLSVHDVRLRSLALLQRHDEYEAHESEVSDKAANKPGVPGLA